VLAPVYELRTSSQRNGIVTAQCGRGNRRFARSCAPTKREYRGGMQM
jgi:hypothetical protein